MNLLYLYLFTVLIAHIVIGFIHGYGKGQITIRHIVKGVFNESLGTTPNVPVLLDTLKKTTRDNADKAFGDALKGAKPIELPEGEFTRNNINKIRETWDKVVSDIGDPTKLTQPELLHRVQSKLGEEARGLASSSVGSERNAAKEIGKLREKIIDKLEDSTGGKFKAAQSQYKDDLAIQDAFDIKNRPDFFAREFATASKAEKEAIRLGARTAVDNLIGQSKRAASTGSAIPESEFNLAKLKTVLGEKEANRLAKLLKDEIEIAKTNTALLGGSQTEIRRGLAQSVAPRDVQPINQNAMGLTSSMAALAGGQVFGAPGLLAAGVPMAYGAVRNVAQRVGRAVDKVVSASGDEAQRALKFLSEKAGAQNRLAGAVKTGTTAVGSGSIPKINEQVERSPLVITVRKKFTGGGS